ncbi:MAG: hypothetical protein HY951_19425 [Bacteroidia bacterium]|nr:hypothetical protein [Bacteroidia bacterium]
MEINILGFGLMGKQIASLFFLGGHNVVIWNHQEIDLNEAYRQIKLLKKVFNCSKEGQITVISSLDKLADNLTIEAVIEDLNIKKQIYDTLKTKITKGYFTNSSSYAPKEIGETVNGLHFFNPITLKLVELCLSDYKITNEAELILDFLHAISFEIVKVGNNRGYIGNYILFNEIASTLKLIEIFGYDYESINVIDNKLYNGRNVFRVIDIIGIDVVYQILLNLNEKDPTFYLPKCLVKALANNILGKKNNTSIEDVLRK